MYITSLRSPRRFCPKSLGSYGQWPKFWTLHSLLHCRSGLARVYPSPDQGGLPYYLRLAPSCTSCLGHLGWAIWSRAIIWKVLLSLEATPSDGIASHATFISRNLRRKRKTSAADSCRQISWQVSDIGDSLLLTSRLSPSPPRCQVGRSGRWEGRTTTSLARQVWSNLTLYQKICMYTSACVRTSPET